MAVTFSSDLTEDRYWAEVYGGGDDALPAETTAEGKHARRQLAVCKQITEDRAPDGLPELLADECVYRLGRYLGSWRSNRETDRRVPGQAWMYSGCGMLVAKYRRHRVAVTE